MQNLKTGKLHLAYKPIIPAVYFNASDLSKSTDTFLQNKKREANASLFK
jgi:hypothetical protein